MRNGNLLKSRVSVIRVKRIHVNQVVGVYSWHKQAFNELVSSNIVFTMHRGGIYPFLTSPFATEAIIVNPLDEK